MSKKHADDADLTDFRRYYENLCKSVKSASSVCLKKLQHHFHLLIHILCSKAEFFVENLVRC